MQGDITRGCDLGRAVFLRIQTELSPPIEGPLDAVEHDQVVGLELDDDVFFKPDLELEEAIESSRIFPPEE